MNISKYEQRVLHVLAQGGYIRHFKEDGRKVREVICFTRDGSVLSDCTLGVFKRLRRRKLIKSEEGEPYQITYLGRCAVRPQLDNR